MLVTCTQGPGSLQSSSYRGARWIRLGFFNIEFGTPQTAGEVAVPEGLLRAVGLDDSRVRVIYVAQYNG
jgi:hypothetical protein